MSTEASLVAYDEIVDSLPRKRGIVFQEIEHSADGFGPRGMTIDELCRILEWRYSTTSARVFELAEAGMIKDTGETRGRQTVWVASRPDEVDALKAARKAARKARKSPRVRRLEVALSDALDLLEADGNRHNVWRAALNDTQWPPEDA